MKAILSLENGVIPANTNFERENPEIRSDLWNIKFPREAVPWPGPDIRRASICNYGFGGSNTHVILEDARYYLKSHQLDGFYTEVPQSTQPEGLAGVKAVARKSLHSAFTADDKQDWHKNRLLLFSAPDKNGIARMGSLYRDYLARMNLKAGEDSEFLDGLAHTLASKRSLLKWRSFNVSDNLTTLMGLKLRTPVRAHRDPTLVFVFTGQGAQYAGMGRRLL